MLQFGSVVTSSHTDQEVPAFIPDSAEGFLSNRELFDVI